MKNGQEQLNVLIPPELKARMLDHLDGRKESQAKFVRRALSNTIDQDEDAEAPDLPPLDDITGPG